MDEVEIYFKIKFLDGRKSILFKTKKLYDKSRK